jgi:hypothetical protein
LEKLKKCATYAIYTLVDLCYNKNKFMQMNKLKFAILFINSICFFNLLAQESVSASGGNSSGIGGTESYTIGQVFCNSNLGDNISIEQGVQHSYNITIINSIDKGKRMELSCIIYPNPTINSLKLKVEDINVQNLNYKLFDLNSNVIINGEIFGNETIINTVALVSGTYFLKIFSQNQEIKLFKIIKTK